ncbi:MAG: endonuclease III, partial [Pseudomonadales bacterium]|nr:endonuclease III [Pseudomonadales bacterium]
MLKKERAAFAHKVLNRLYKSTPVPLNHSDNYTLLVAVLLSAQCTDIRVNQVTPALFKLANNAKKMATKTPDQLYPIIKPCGLAPRKSRAIVELSQILMDKYNGEVPEDIELLE